MSQKYSAAVFDPATMPHCSTVDPTTMAHPSAVRTWIEDKRTKREIKVDKMRQKCSAAAAIDRIRDKYSAKAFDPVTVSNCFLINLPKKLKGQSQIERTGRKLHKIMEDRSEFMAGPAVTIHYSALYTTTNFGGEVSLDGSKRKWHRSSVSDQFEKFNQTMIQRKRDHIKDLPKLLKAHEQLTKFMDSVKLMSPTNAYQLGLLVGRKQTEQEMIEKIRCAKNVAEPKTPRVYKSASRKGISHATSSSSFKDPNAFNVTVRQTVCKKTTTTAGKPQTMPYMYRPPGLGHLITTAANHPCSAPLHRYPANYPKKFNPNVERAVYDPDCSAVDPAVTASLMQLLRDLREKKKRQTERMTEVRADVPSVSVSSDQPQQLTEVRPDMPSVSVSSQQQERLGDVRPDVPSVSVSFHPLASGQPEGGNNFQADPPSPQEETASEHDPESDEEAKDSDEFDSDVSDDEEEKMIMEHCNKL